MRYIALFGASGRALVSRPVSSGSARSPCARERKPALRPLVCDVRLEPDALSVLGRPYDRGGHDRPDLANLTRNAVDVLPEGELERKLAAGRPLRVKLGIDVTAPDVHVGHAIPLQRMAAFQRAGHVGVLIIGDYTTRIGDPSAAR